MHTFGCYAEKATIRAFSTAVTGFSADGNYVTGQAPAYFTCGFSRTFYSCAQITWDLAGNLVSATDTIEYSRPGALVSYNCPDLGLVMPSRTPPSTTVVGNSFTNPGGYVAETLLSQPCGAIACYGLPIYAPILLTP